ncbi:MAG: NUDIX hydrolase [Chlamydiales bacterium]|nr:NUDIX hydrolase [Chlamydiales bacterium]
MESKSEKQAALEKSTKVESRIVHKGHTLDIRVDTFILKGKQRQWDVILHPGAVAILPINSDGELLLIKQWRRAAERILIELPAGTLDAGEPPDVCAQRELQEETGYRAQELIGLGGFFTAPGFCTEYIHFFIARELTPSYLEADDDEGIDLLPVSLKLALEMIDSGTICDAKTIAGIMRYERWLKIHGK